MYYCCLLFDDVYFLMAFYLGRLFPLICPFMTDE